MQFKKCNYVGASPPLFYYYLGKMLGSLKLRGMKGLQERHGCSSNTAVEKQDNGK